MASKELEEHLREHVLPVLMRGFQRAREAPPPPSIEEQVQRLMDEIHGTGRGP